MALGQRRSEVVNFSNYESARSWFEKQPHEVAATIAVRAALRVLPLCACAYTSKQDQLAVFRALAASWASARYPGRAELKSALPNYPYKERPYTVPVLDASGVAARSAFAAAAHDAAACVVTVYKAGHDAAEDAFLEADSRPAPDVNSAAEAAYQAHVDALSAVEQDASLIEDGKNPTQRRSCAVDLAGAAIWQLYNIPASLSAAWAELKGVLLEAQEGWEVWTDWYEDRLVGRSSLGEAFDIALATLPDDLWKRGPAAVNGRIKELIAEYALDR
jgi:hypothetical protein